MPDLSKLTERRKAARAEMARLIQELCAEKGANCEVEERGREVMIDIILGGARVSIWMDGDRRFNSQPDVHCTPWNVCLDSASA